MKLLFASPEIGIFQLSLLLHLELLCMLLSVIHVLGDEVSTPETCEDYALLIIRGMVGVL
jgi:hypothetical protein